MHRGLGLLLAAHLLGELLLGLTLQTPDVLHGEAVPLVLPGPRLAVGSQHSFAQSCGAGCKGLNIVVVNVHVFCINVIELSYLGDVYHQIHFSTFVNIIVYDF